MTKEEQKKLDKLTSEGFLKIIQDSGLKVSFEKYLKSHTDTAITKALETRNTNTENEKKTLEERIKELENKLELGDRNSTVLNALKEAEIPEGYAKVIKSSTKEDIEKEVATLKEVLSGQAQQETDKKLENGELSTIKSDAGEKVTNESISSYVKTKQAGKNVKSEFRDGQYQLENSKE